MDAHDSSGGWVTHSGGRAGSLLIAFIISLTVATVALGAQPAWAHEFPLALATALDPTTSSAAVADRLSGFRLAVDQSPDVSHPAGEDGGDHLGGIDVAIEVVDLRVPGAAATPVGPGAHRGVAVVIGSHDALISWAARTRDFDLVIAVQTTPGTGTALPAPSITLVPLGDTTSTMPAYPEFARAYAEVHGVQPTVDAGLGYDAGLMVDAVIGAMGTDTSNADVLAATSEAAADGLTTSRLAAPRISPTTPTARGGGSGRWSAAIALALVAVVSGALLFQRRRHV